MFPQRINALLALEKQRNIALKNIKRRKQTMVFFFNRRAKAAEFKIEKKVLLGFNSC
jgi:hypothetical protein